MYKLKRVRYGKNGRRYITYTTRFHRFHRFRTQSGSQQALMNARRLGFGWLGR